MPELVKIQCPCGAVFQTLPGMGIQDFEGNFVCDNCAVEQGLKEDLDAEPAEVVVVVVPEGGEAQELETPQSVQEEAQVLVEAVKVDGRTRAAREAKKAAGAS